MSIRPRLTPTRIVGALTALALATGGVVTPASAAPNAHHARLAKNYAVGDSVMIDAKSSIQRIIPSLTVNAAVSRQVSSGIAVLRYRKAHHQLNDRIVFGLGTNGSFTAGQVKSVIGLTRGHKLVIVTTHCPYCGWTDSNNRTVARLCTPRAHCWVAPFQRAARQHPEWFSGDGVHMPSGGAGARAYARLVKGALQRAARG